ncbi:MAG: chemotaxis response regulator protein-glutamate methylesterase [Ancalomicrobiaceae bacterium]|nr:chemotaxis response regulator protein-glutamate methylesterase [Ancalomicrobiaceae bacterium]
MLKPRIKVLVVDDSSLMRQMLSEMLASDAGIEVVGTASDPLIARERIKAANPDVITLDIEMPRMDGLEFLSKLMTLRPMPVVMISSLTQHGAEATVRALELGAVDFVTKPSNDLVGQLPALRDEIVAKVKAAASVRVRQRDLAAEAGRRTRLTFGPGYRASDRILAIGASTGGVEAITAVIAQLPANAPGTVIVLHMPPKFTLSFAQRLDGLAAMHVTEAVDGARVIPGHAFIAPGGRHMRLSRSGGQLACRIGGTDRAGGHCPSVDVLFRSVAEAAGRNAVGLILTGMGKDGANGLLDMRRAGARTLGQNEASSLVYGMPRVAFEIGAVEEQVDLAEAAARLLGLAGADDSPGLAPLSPLPPLDAIGEART